jgi:hypothetical protein
VYVSIFAMQHDQDERLSSSELFKNDLCERSARSSTISSPAVVLTVCSTQLLEAAFVRNSFVCVRIIDTGADMSYFNSAIQQSARNGCLMDEWPNIHGGVTRFARPSKIPARAIGFLCQGRLPALPRSRKATRERTPQPS